MAGRWCFTMNNPPAGWLILLKEMAGVSYGVVGEEKAPKTGTPHLQGYIEVTPRKRLTALGKMVATAGLPSAHWTVANGSAIQNRTYCSKEGKFEEWGEAKQQGRRSDLQDLCELAQQEDIGFLEMARKMPSTHARNWRWAKKLTEEAALEREMKRRKKEAASYRLTGWQDRAWTRLRSQSKRQILWCWETSGRVGKTEMATWLGAVHGAFLFTGGKYADVAYAYQKEEIVVMDLARDQEERVPYGLLENWKDGKMMCGKYESTVMLFPPARVVVFANFEPDRSKMSEDRWDVMDL